MSDRRSFLKLIGLAAAGGSGLSSQAVEALVPEADRASVRGFLVRYEMRRIVFEGMQVRDLGFYEEGTRSLGYVFDTLAERSASRYQWVLTRLEPVDV